MIDNKNFLKTKSSFLSLRDIVFILVAFLVIALFYFIPTADGLTHNGQLMIGILLMAAILWITEPIPLPVTGLLIMVMQPLLHIRTPTQVFSSFGSNAVFFLIGAFIIAGAIEKHGLHRRIALKFLSLFENNPRFFTFGIMLSCASLSFVMPEHGVAALFLPIIVSILIAMEIVPKQSNFGKVSMLAVAYGCSIGSLGTLIGGARNIYTVDILQQADINVTFFEWMTYSIPVVIIALPLVWFILQFSFPIEIRDISAAKREISQQVVKAGKISKDELIVLFILILTILLWVLFSSTTYYGLAVISILGSILLFLTRSISWKDVENRVPWGLIILYGGAITLGIGMQTTGAGGWIADGIFNIAGNNPLIVILAMILFTVILTNIMSNIAAVAILLPIGLSIATTITNISPLLASMTIALTGGLAFVFVISTPGNAITYSSGYFSTRDLLKAGVLANVLCIILIFVIAVVYWIGVLHL